MFQMSLHLLRAAAGKDVAALKTHKAVLTAVSRDLVHTGRMSAAAGQFLNEAQRLRLIADYGEQIVTRSEAERALAMMDDFFAAASKLLEGDTP